MGKPGDRRDRLKYVQEQIETAKGRAVADLSSGSESDEEDEVSTALGDFV